VQRSLRFTRAAKVSASKWLILALALALALAHLAHGRSHADGQVAYARELHD